MYYQLGMVVHTGNPVTQHTKDHKFEPSLDKLIRCSLRKGLGIQLSSNP